ncbi:TPA: calcium-binding protein [Kluyvera ascorbata]
MLTIDEANRKLATITTAEELRNLLNELDVNCPGETTVLYSGSVTKDIHTSSIVSELDNTIGIRLIDKTEASVFLIDNPDLEYTLQRIFDDDPRQVGSKSNQFLYGEIIDGVRQPNGAWDIISQRFVAETTGEVRLLVGMNTDPTRVFGATELPALMDNPNITTIEGIPKSELSGKSTSEIFKLLRDSAWQNIMGTDLIHGHIDSWLNITPESYSDVDYINNLRKELRTLNDAQLTSYKKTANDLAEISTKLIKHAPLVGKTLLGASLAMVAAESSAAMDRGDKSEAISIWIEFALEEFGGEIVATLARIAAGAAATTVGAPASVIAAVGFGTAVLGGFITAETVDQYADLIRDHDANGVMDLLDRMKNVFTGVNDQLPNRLPPGFTPEHRYTLDTRSSASAMAAMAKNSLAYRYALINLNPFVITDYNYSAYALNPEYQYANYSEQYWQDRAKMTYWRIQYQLQGLDVSEQMNSDSTYGNYDFVDMSTPLSGSDYMQLSIDGRGISMDDHKIIFGSQKSDSITGAGGSDHLYGNEGNDVISGAAGSDYLEGGNGDDTLEGGSGQDILYGGEGRNVIYGGSKDELDDGEADTLYGGTGFNTYIVDEYDTIIITAGSNPDGAIFLKNADGQLIELTEAILEKKENTDENSEAVPETEADSNITYLSSEGDKYYFDGDTLVINDGLRIVDFKKYARQTKDSDGGDIYSAMGITLREEGEPDDEPDDGAAEETVSPVVIDLNGNGVETLSDKEVYFDHANDGLKELSGWVAATDGLLVRDLNGDGKITSGLELFGNNTRLRDGSIASNGFQALAELDDNLDGSLDSNDKAWSSLHIWQDKNSNGKTDDGELYSMADAGITAVNVRYSASTYQDDNGEYHKQISNVTLDNGITAACADIWFKVDKSVRIHNNDLPLTEEVIRLPNARGFGHLPDLRQAMVADDILQALLRDYLIETDRTKKDALLDKLIYQWAGVQDVKATQLYAITLQQVAVIEQLTMSPYNNKYSGSTVGDSASLVLLNEYQKFRNYTEAQILAQTYLYEELKDVVLTGYNSRVTGLVLSLSAAEQLIHSLYLNGEYGKLDDVTQALFNLSIYSDNNRVQLVSLYVNLIKNEPGMLQYLPSLTVNDNIILGDDGSNTLSGNADDNIFSGGKGNDVLKGEGGDDIYIFNVGDGQDIIKEYHGERDIIYFSEGLSPEQVEFSRDWDDLIVGFRGSDDSVTITDFFLADDYKVEKLAFANGFVWDLTERNSQFLVGTEGNQTLWAFPEGNEIHAAGGDDVLFGELGNDILYGDNGSDELIGNEGDDILSGGQGNDALCGGGGNDTYLFNVGDGHDVIYGDTDDSWNNTHQEQDILRLGSGILPDQIQLQRKDGNLLITIGDGADSITVIDYFHSNTWPIAQIVFADGSVWDTATILDGVVVIKDVVQNLIAQEEGSVLEAGSHDDTLTGLSGDDRLYGNDGNDTLTGGAGQDILTGGAGSDTYVFNAGDGMDIIEDCRYADNLDQNILRIGDGLHREDSHVARYYDDLVIDFRGGDDCIVIPGYFAQDVHPVDLIIFADGSLWDIAAVEALAQVGTDEDQTLIASDHGSVIYAGGGDDVLYGGRSDDVLAGGTGNDVLYGGSGHDTYLFNAGDGQDRITANFSYGDIPSPNADNESYVPGTLVLGDGLLASNTIADKSGADLTITFRDNSDSITVENYFDQDRCLVDLITFADGTVWNYATVQAQILIGSDEAQTLWAFDRGSNIHAAGGNDKLYGSDVDDALYGDDGDDRLMGHGGHDILVGGAGNDTLEGGEDGDTYLFNAGDGQDIISESRHVNETNTLHFGDGLLAENAVMQQWDNDLIIYFQNSADSVTIKNYFSTEGGDELLYQIEQIMFADGTVWDTAAVLSQIHTGTSEAQTLLALDCGSVIHAAGGNDSLYGAGGNDALYGDAGNDTLDGASGEDTLYGGDGNDALFGGDGDDLLSGGEGDDALKGEYGRDMLYGDAGNDMLTGGFDNDWLSGGDGNDSLDGGDDNDLLAGGTGNDSLKGGTGSDTYLFNVGDGQDTITEGRKNTGDADTLRFGEGVQAKDARIQRNGGDLVINFSGNTDSVTVKNYFTAAKYQVEHISFADGTDWAPEDILNYVEYDIQLPLAAPTDAPISMSLIREQMAAFMSEFDDDADSIVDFGPVLSSSRIPTSPLFHL